MLTGLQQPRPRFRLELSHRGAIRRSRFTRENLAPKGRVAHRLHLSYSTWAAKAGSTTWELRLIVIVPAYYSPL